MISDPPEVETETRDDRPAPPAARDREEKNRNRERPAAPPERAAPASPTAPHEPEEPPAGGGRRPRRYGLWALALAALAIAIYLLVPHGSKGKGAEGGSGTRTQSGKGGKGGPGGGGGGPVPVLAVPAQVKDVGVYLSGLGTVVPLNTVTVKSRVDGQLLRIHFHEGQLVRAGDLLAELDPRPFQVQLMQAQGQRAKDEAALKNARVDLARYQVLVQQDSIPRQQLDTQAAAVAQLEASLQSDQAQIESARLNLTYSRITAPTGGRVGLRLMDLGNIVHAGDPTGIVTITQLQPINVLFTLPGDQLPQVLPQVHGGRKLVVEAYDRDLKRKLGTGELLAVDNQIDPTTGTVRMKALFGNDTEALFPNQFVNSRLLVNTLRNAVTIPAAALQRSPQATFVYVVKPDNTVEVRNVTVQLTEGEDAAIQSGLKPGERVVVDGVDKLRPGAKVSLPGSEGSGGSAGRAVGGVGGGGHRGQGRGQSGGRRAQAAS
jgi:multidrug efflux system membrane fusion protein